MLRLTLISIVVTRIRVVMDNQDNESKQKKAAEYLRVSTNNQAMEDSYGLPVQKGAILAYTRN